MEERETEQIRKVAETIRRELRIYVGHGGSSASFAPRLKRAQRHVQHRDLDKALRVLRGVEGDLRARL